MVLGTFRLGGLGALLAASAAMAGPPVEAAVTIKKDPAPAAPLQAERWRRVELPFPLEFRAPQRETRQTAPRREAAPHPFREDLLKRAARQTTDSGVSAPVARRLSRFPEFS